MDNCKVDNCNNNCCYKNMCLKHYKKYWNNLKPEYITWCNIKSRCHNKNLKCYKNYGGRGIKICDEWKNNYTAFYNYIGKKPTPEHSLDRIDNDGDYEPGNVRWSTRKTQNNNRRDVNKFMINKNNTSGITGVYWDKANNEWRVRINRKHVTYNLGNYKNLEDAIKARKNIDYKTLKLIKGVE